MPIILANALLADWDPPRVETGELRVDAGVITHRGAAVPRSPGDESVDCAGCMVLPGLVNGHTHLYSALAVGMPPPPQTPRNFLEILKFVWWRLDRALDAESIELSARVGALQALRCGTTTLIDHHASPNFIAGSLDLVEKGLSGVGLRGVLCYETTDRHGLAGREAGLAENRRYLALRRDRGDGRFAGLVGAHASFTLEDESLGALADLSREFNAGVHIHVAEDPCDEADSRAHRGKALIERLATYGLLHPSSVFAHGTHLDAAAIAGVNAAGVTMAHNARSNMNNGVGYAPVSSFKCPVMLGTDGIGGDMVAETKAAWFISRHQHSSVHPTAFLAMLAAAARRASASLRVPLGTLATGAAADVVITDYRPSTPLTTENLVGHFMFGMTAGHVRHVLVAGEWRMRDHVVSLLDELQSTEHASRAAAALWQRIQRISV